MKVFIGHSFKDEDKNIVKQIKDFISTLELEIITGEKAECSTISQKVQDRIKECDIFIGILTKEKPIKTHWFNLFPKTYSTSPCVIQESGYAIAKCKKNIFLFEEEVYTRLGLQADAEYLIFNRKKSLDSVFIKLNQMLNTLIKNTNNTVDITKRIENMSLPSVEKEQLTTSDEESIVEDQQHEQKMELIIQLEYSSDYEIVKQSYNALMQAETNEQEKINYEALFLYRSELLGQNGSIDKLEQLSIKYPDNIDIKLHLANYYKTMQAFDKAIELYKDIIDKYNNTEDKQTLANICYLESECIALNSDYEEGIGNLKKKNDKCTDNKYLYKYIAKLAHKNEDWKTYFNYAEYYLKNEPNDKEFRFDLAYTYSNHKKEKLSFYHYKILTDTSNSATYYNNIAILYENHSLNIKAVQSFKKAIELNESLAISNLANSYINAGFTEEAKNMLNKVGELRQKHITIHENIGHTESRLKKAEQNEVEKEKELFNDAKKQNIFMQEYAKKYCSQTEVDISKLSGTWETHIGELDFQFKQNDFEYVFKINKKSDTEYTEYGIKGSITNHTFEAQEKNIEHNKYSNIESRGLFGSILSGLYKDTILGIISDDYKSIKICIINEKQETQYHIWNKIN